MSEELLVRHCSPTLAGMTTGSMFTCSYTNITELREYLRRLNQMLVKKGLRVLPLRIQQSRALIYVYRPHRLKKDLCHHIAEKLLRERDYNLNSTNTCVLELMKRLKECEEFPHEIGLFLGYPPEDVDGFITNKASDCKCVGTWKVYGDVASAQRTFAKYKKCTDVYCTQYACGRSIERLTVAEY